MKKTGFRKQTKEEIRTKALKKKEKELQKKATKAKKKYIKSLPNKLKDLCHDFIRNRDSLTELTKNGYCCSCGEYATGSEFQAGHYSPSGATGVLLRYHPYNIHGQCANCNLWRNQEAVKVRYAEFMYRKYNPFQLENMRILRNKTILADSKFYEDMIELYKAGNQLEIVKYLEGYL